MNTFTNNIIKLDIHRSNGYQTIHARQYEKNSRTIVIEIYENGIPRPIMASEKVKMRYTRPDGKWDIVDAIVQSENEAYFSLSEKMLWVDGIVVADVGIYLDANTGNTDDDKMISTFMFHVNVEKACYDEKNVMASSEVSTLIKLIAEQRILKQETIELNDYAQVLITQMEQMLKLDL